MKEVLRHWFWIVLFRDAKLRLQVTRLLTSERKIDVRFFSAPPHLNTRLDAHGR